MKSFDVVVIGSGPGGYVAAIRAAQLGMKAALVEREKRLGGTCLRIGCIPSKALLQSSELYHEAQARLAEHGIGVDKVQLDLSRMLERKTRVVHELTDGIGLLMKKNKVTVYTGQGRLVAPERVAVDLESGETQELRSNAIILATGSVPTSLPNLPLDGERVVDSEGALSFSEVPEHLLVVGGGYIGLELGSVWRRLGAQVTVVEMMDRIVPHADRQAAKVLQRSLKRLGLDIRLQHKVVGAERTGDDGNKVAVSLQDREENTDTLEADRVLVAVGRQPYTEGLGLREAGVDLDDGGRVKVDDSFATSSRGIYAIGDLVRGPMLAHKASEEGVALVETLAGKPGHVSYRTIPAVVYTFPELAAVGLTEEQAKEQGREVRVGRFYFKANGRAKTMGETEGFVKILADPDRDALLGAHIVGPNASDLIAEVVVAMEMQASTEDLARMVHAHPTLAEAVKEAALAVDRRAIHG
jgi:dihydrolipoamide dehydrogenase